MWKLTWLFSLILLALSLAQTLKESMSLRVKVVGRILEEKPKLLPPKELSLEGGTTYLDLSSRILEPPRQVEEAPLETVGEGGGCGEPRDRSYYRAGINYYVKGEMKEAESALLDLISLQNSPFIPQAKYLLGLLYSQTDREREALEFFKSSCSDQHPYKGPACEAYYALEFKLKGEPLRTEGPDLWRKVYLIKKEGRVEAPNCDGTVFQKYCSYVVRFVKGEVDEDYRESTELRRAFLLIKQNSLKEAKDLLLKHSRSKRYREVALYYLGVVCLLEGDRRSSYEYASLLEISDPELSKNLYLIASKGDLSLLRIAYRQTKSNEVLKEMGILSYNLGKYDIAYAELTRAGEYLLAAMAAIQKGDYERAHASLKESKRTDREYYLWLLEVLYWLGKDREMEVVLGEIKERFPDLHSEYLGWLMFKKERWAEASRYFQDPYHKALALYNGGSYREVLGVLKGRDTPKERALKAKAALSLGDGKLAREFLRGENEEETYLTGLSFFIEKRYREAIPYFEKLLRSETFRSKAKLRLADSYYNLEEYEKARELYREILTLHPDSQEALDATLALAQIELQKPTTQLENLVEEFAKRFPHSPLLPDLRYQLANLYMREGKDEEARKVLEELLKVDGLRGKVLVKLAQLEQDPKRKEELLKEAVRVSKGEDKERASEMLTNLYLQRKEFGRLAEFFSQGDFEDRKKALDLYMEEDLQKAIELFDRLVAERPQDEGLRERALKLYHMTKGEKYLHVAKGSRDRRIRAEALYLLGNLEKRVNKRKALEYFVEVVLTAEGVQPYYNASVLEGVDILLSLKARKDASCLLDKIDQKHLSEEELERVKILRKELPKCEVKR